MGLNEAGRQTAMMMYTIYDQPQIWPRYRVRAHIITAGGPVTGDALGMGASLGLARLTVPPAANVRLPRSPSDPPEIVEVWL